MKLMVSSILTEYSGWFSTDLPSYRFPRWVEYGWQGDPITAKSAWAEHAWQKVEPTCSAHPLFANWSFMDLNQCFGGDCKFALTKFLYFILGSDALMRMKGICKALVSSSITAFPNSGNGYPKFRIRLSDIKNLPCKLKTNTSGNCGTLFVITIYHLLLKLETCASWMNEWDEMKWNEMKWNEMKWNEMTRNNMKLSSMKWMKWHEMKWTEMKRHEVKLDEMQCKNEWVKLLNERMNAWKK